MNGQTIKSTSSNAGDAALINRIDADTPIEWLEAGVRDFKAAPGPSLLYGILFSAAAAATLYLSWNLPGFAIAFLTGLVLIGPLLAVGLYAAARQIEAGEPVSIAAALSLIRSRATNLALFSLMLVLIMAAWVRVSALLFAVKFNSFSIGIESYTGLLTSSGDPVVAAYFFVIGFVLAVTVFVIGAVSIPIILDRNCNPFTAVGTSARTVAKNWPAMLVWASIILIMTGAGVATLFIGMVVLFPILGYATWHSYRGLVRWQ